MIHYLVLAILVAAAGAAPDVAPDSKATQTAEDISVDQILPYNVDARSNSSSPDQIGVANKGAKKQANVSQLPGDIEIIDTDSAGPERAIVRKVDSPEVRLYSQVAEVWELIRRRGQQPTPELIAREIGPNALASFLDQNPGAETIFGRDSDSLPLNNPGELQLPDGGGTLILPPTGGGQ